MSAGDWRAVDWREHLRWVRVGDRWVNVCDIGTGPPVVLVHGLGASWQCWLQNIPDLARAHRVIAPDLPGFGASEMPVDDISIPGYGAAVDAVCDAIDLDEAATVVGNSMGGFIGTEVAIQAPERVARLVLVSAAGFWGETRRAGPTVRAARLTHALTAWATARVQEQSARARLRRFALRQGGVHRPQDIPLDLAQEVIDAAGREGFLDGLGALADYSVRDRLTEIACPTLIVWGRDDPLVRVSDADEYERLIPDARKVVWDGVGHVAMLERPDEFNALVEAFIDDGGAAVDGAAAPAGAQASAGG